MPKLQVNDDGTITLPLRHQPPITIGEPSMADLAWLTEETEKVEVSLPPFPVVPTPQEDGKIAPEDARLYNDAVALRTKAVYSGEMPYGTLLIEAIKRFSAGEQVVDADSLPSWAASPVVLRTMLETFRAPLPGEG